MSSEPRTPQEDQKWAQCDRCGTWRRLPPHVDVDRLPERWFCEMNVWDAARARCDAPEPGATTPDAAAADDDEEAPLPRPGRRAIADSDEDGPAPAPVGEEADAQAQLHDIDYFLNAGECDETWLTWRASTLFRISELQVGSQAPKRLRDGELRVSEDKKQFSIVDAKRREDICIFHKKDISGWLALGEDSDDEDREDEFLDLDVRDARRKKPYKLLLELARRVAAAQVFVDSDRLRAWKYILSLNEDDIDDDLLGEIVSLCMKKVCLWPIVWLLLERFSDQLASH